MPHIINGSDTEHPSWFEHTYSSPMGLHSVLLYTVLYYGLHEAAHQLEALGAAVIRVRNLLRVKRFAVVTNEPHLEEREKKSSKGARDACLSPHNRSACQPVPVFQPLVGIGHLLMCQGSSVQRAPECAYWPPVYVSRKWHGGDTKVWMLATEVQEKRHSNAPQIMACL